MIKGINPEQPQDSKPLIPLWKQCLDDCNDILECDDGDGFGHDFIESVSEWIEEHETVTDKQQIGINNIREIYEKRGWL